MSTVFRTEQDSMGELKVPVDALIQEGIRWNYLLAIAASHEVLGLLRQRAP